MNCCKDKNKLSRPITKYLAILLLLLITSAWRPAYASGNADAVEMNYFYISVCASCHDVEEYLNGVSDQCSPKLKAQNRKLRIYRYNTAEGENINLLKRFYAAYHVPEKDQSLPVVFFGNTWLAGEKEIKRRLAEELPAAESGSPVGKNDGADKKSAFEDFYGLKPLSSFTAGFVNGLTPCSLSMLLFFISMLLARKIHIMKMGLLYCAGKFLAYFLLGMVFFKMLGGIHAVWLESAVKIVMLAAIAVFIFLNAMDFLAARREKYERIKLQLPSKLRGFNHQWIKTVSAADSPGALAAFSFLLGIGTSVGEFLCTGQIYLTTILYVLHHQTALNSRALLYFLEYSLAFVTPLLIITFIVSRGKELLDVSEFIRKNMHRIKLINIFVFLLFGLYLLFLS